MQCLERFPYYVIIPEKRVDEMGRASWCHIHIGKYAENWYSKISHNEDIIDLMVYYFIDEGDAIMFKMKFG